MQTVPTFPLVKAKRIQIVNSEGNTVVEIGFRDSDGTGGVKTYDNEGNEIFSTLGEAKSLQTVQDVIRAKAIYIMNDDGKPVVTLASSEDGGALDIFNEDGEQRVRLGVSSEDEGIVKSLDKKGNALFQLCKCQSTMSGQDNPSTSQSVVSGQDSSSTNFNDWILGKWTNEMGSATCEFSSDTVTFTQTVDPSGPPSLTMIYKIVGNKLIAQFPGSGTNDMVIYFYEIKESPDSFILAEREQYSILINPELIPDDYKSNISQVKSFITYTRVP